MIDTARKAVRHPWTALRWTKATLTRPLVTPPSETIVHFERDWDNLLLLDACRYDAFAACSPIDGQLTEVYSSASHTTGFLERNLDRPRPDTVYVTASPQLVGYEDRLHEVVHVWEDRWDAATDTVLPGDVAEVAAATAATYPDKRLVVHFMQPHYPFLGPTAAEIGDLATFTGQGTEREKASIWDLLTAGRVSEERVRAAYRETLEFALPHVQRLASALSGKTVVSSDHGNLFRERVSALPVRLSGHPMGYPHEELLAVPWLECPYDERRRTTATEQPAETSVETDRRTVEAATRLSRLGYRS